MIPLFSNVITWYPTYSTDMVRYDVNYWMEPLPGQSLADAPAGSVQNYGGRTYLKNEMLSQTLYTKQSTFSGKNIDGMELRASTNAEQENGFVYDFYYGRKPVKIQYQTNGGSTIAARSNVLHGEKIESYLPSDPQRTNAIFEGWYYDDAFQNPVDWQNDTVSASAYRGLTPTVVETVTLYAKWHATDYTISFYERKSGIGQAPLDMQFAGSGDYADLSQPIVMTVDGKQYPLIEGVQVPGYGTFLGWYFVTATGNTAGSFSDQIAIKRNYDVYAHWKTDGFRVTYEKGDATQGNAPNDSGTYMIGTQTRALGNTGGMSAGELVFAGWRSNLDGRIYRPGQLMTIKGDTVLTAVWNGRMRLIFAADSGSKEYDGTPFTVANATLAEGTLVEADAFRVKMTPESSITEPGTRPNVIESVVILRNGADVTAEYDIAPFVDGILSVTARSAVESPAPDDPENGGNTPTAPENPNAPETPWEPDGKNDTVAGVPQEPDLPDDMGTPPAAGTEEQPPVNAAAMAEQAEASGNQNSLPENQTPRIAAHAQANEVAGSAVTAAGTPSDAVTGEAYPVSDAAENPAGLETIYDNGIPLAGVDASWSLADLLLMILSAVAGLTAGIAWLLGRKKKEDQTRRHTGLITVAGIAAAILSVVVFLLTQDMRLPMVWFDRWTLLMALLAGAGTVAAALGLKRYKQNTEEKNTAV